MTLPLRRSLAIPTTWTRQCVRWTPRTPSRSAMDLPLSARDLRLRSTVPSTSDKDARFWPSSPRDQEGEHPESLSSVEEERDDSFSSVIDLIRSYHSLEKPASAAPARGLSTLSHALGLHTESSPDLHLPPSHLVEALVDKVNSTFDKFIDEQTPSAFIPWPMKRQRRYYRTSKPLFAAPYTVPPGLSSLTLDKASEPKKQPVVIPHNLVSSFETALAGVD